MHVRARLNTLLVVLVWIRESWYGAFFVRLLWVVCEPELLAVVIGVLLYACTGNTKILNLQLNRFLFFLLQYLPGRA
jgi:hypothetical protein